MPNRTRSHLSIPGCKRFCATAIVVVGGITAQKFHRLAVLFEGLTRRTDTGCCKCSVALCWQQLGPQVEV